jgi:hypothetical protein
MIRYDIRIFNCNWVDTRRQQYSTHLHTNNTHNTEKRMYITIQKLNICNNKKINQFGKCGLCPVFVSYTLAFALQLIEVMGKLKEEAVDHTL